MSLQNASTATNEEAIHSPLVNTHVVTGTWPAPMSQIHVATEAEHEPDPC